MTQKPTRLDPEALALFAQKGVVAGRAVAQAGEANAVKVRRVMQLIHDLVTPRFEEISVLDLGCAEGVYAIEAGLRGARVLGIDARTQRLSLGAACAERHALTNVRFVQGDARGISRESIGGFEVVLCLGLLYHFDGSQVLPFLERAHDVCSRALVVETIVTERADTNILHRSSRYEVERWREHADEASPVERQSELLKSVDNTFSVYLTRSALCRALHDVGFSSVLECHAPPEPGKPRQRITLVALRGIPVCLETYPWINGSSEAEIAHRLGAKND